ncbi:hypothetical protein EAF04_006427 [Stromatinia cepivora]|nr:hypothetical protein EAF04_006427 [Stromatinia cepivora]
MRYTSKKRQNGSGNQGKGRNNKQTKADPNDGNVNVDQLLMYVTLTSGDVKSAKARKPSKQLIPGEKNLFQLKLRRWDPTSVLDQKPDQNQQQVIYHGFTLHSKQTVLVAAPDMKLCRSSFLYKLSRGKLLVSAAAPEQDRQASKVEGDIQKITVWTYRGTNRDMQDLDDGIDYVFCGDNSKYKPFLKSCYMRLEDLKRRIHYDHEALSNDYETYIKDIPPFPVWNADGQLGNYRNFDGMYQARWRAGSETQVHHRIREGFANIMKVAHGAQCQPKRLYNVLARFWDPKFTANARTQIDTVKLYLVIPSRLINRITNDFSQQTAIKLVKTNIEKMFADSKLNFKPQMSNIDVRFCSSANFLQEFPLDTYKIVGQHPTMLYSLVTSIADFEILNNASTTKIYREPLQFNTEDPAELTKIFKEIVGDLHTLKNPVEQNGQQINAIKFEGGVGTITTVSNASAEAAVGIKRELSQNQVMANQGANAIMNRLFKKDPNDNRKLRAEWLHRSARSFGGRDNADVPGQLANTQAVENLVLGTVETNTTMLRHEMFIKRYVHNAKVGPGDQTASMKVTTRLHHASSPNSRIGGGLTSLWFGHHLVYKFKSKERGASPIINRCKVFRPFDRRVPLRLEGELDIMMEGLIYGWNSLGNEEDDESDDDPLMEPALEQQKEEKRERVMGGEMETEDN